MERNNEEVDALLEDLQERMDAASRAGDDEFDAGFNNGVQEAKRIIATERNKLEVRD